MKKINEQIINDAVSDLKELEISIHCWQTDDVTGLEGNTTLSGGIQSTGNYPGKARNVEEIMQDLKFVINNLAGKFRINLHAMYLISDLQHDRNEITYEDFEKWVEFAKENNVKIDFNPTFFSHEKAESGFTLSSNDEETRKFWVEHGQRCLKISERIAQELDDVCLMNIWIPDGSKEVVLNRAQLRSNLKKSLDEILDIKYDRTKVPVAVESKVFGIGFESFTVGSHEFYLNYANSKNINCLIDTGHYHPTENVADKISAMLLFNDKLALHVTRDVRWDSDHVLLDSEKLSNISDEIVRAGKDRFYIGLDFFDGSINRLFAYISGIRNFQKSYMRAYLNNALAGEVKETSYEILKYEFLKNEFNLNDIWNKYLETNEVLSDSKVLEEIDAYEQNVLRKRV